MSKFNKPPAPRQPDTVTHQGGVGFSRSPHDELFLLGLANMVGEDTFYESGASRDDRFTKLIHEVAATDPEWAASFIGWLRSEGNVRSAPIVAVAEYIRSGAPNGRAVVTSVMQRPDEPGELLGYWLNKYGRKIPQPIKRGIADALPRLYTERNVLRYDGSGNAIRFGDVIELCHPKAPDDATNAIYKHCIERRHGRPVDLDRLPSTLAKDHYLMHLRHEDRRAMLPAAVEAGWDWQRIGGWVPGGMDAQAWEAAIPNMGAMALVRNLRNFDEANISAAAVAEVNRRLTDPEEIRKSRQFPLRFLTAWKNVASMRWGPTLETALMHSLSNVPSLPGRTLVLIDVSGSMNNVALSNRAGRGRPGAAPPIVPYRWEVASLFGLALGQRAEAADVVLFDTQPKAELAIVGAESVLRQTEAIRPYVGGGTDILGSLAATYDSYAHDRVVILTDEQQGYGALNRYHPTTWDAVKHVRCPVVVCNLAGYQPGVTPSEGNWLTIGGLSDACFGAIETFDGRHRDRRWPWDKNLSER